MPTTLPPIRKRSWLLIIIGLFFAAAGIALLMCGVMSTVYDWTRMSSWQPAKAEVLQADLISHYNENSTTYSALARYRFQYAGQTYYNDRVTIGSRSDGAGGVQQQLAYRLQSYLKAKQPIDVWVNPKNPRESVIDRSLPFNTLIFATAFALLFGSIGLAMIFFGWRGSIKEINHPDGAKSPWLKNPAWTDNKILSHQKNIEAWVLGGFALFWNLISIPVATFAITDAIQHHNHKAWIAIIFPLVGLGLIYAVIKTTRDWRRYGDPILTLDPFPGAIGGNFGAQLELPLAYSTEARFKVILNCMMFQPKRADGTAANDKLIWQSEGLATLKPSINGSLLSFRFDIADQLPASEPEIGENYHYWDLIISSQQLSPSFSRTYRVPVYATGEKSQNITQSAESHPIMQKSRKEKIDAVCNINPVAGGISIYLPYARGLSKKIGWMFFGLSFAGAGGFVAFLGEPIIIPIVFAGVGGLIALLSLYSIGNCLRVQLDQQGLNYQRKFLGVVVASAQIPRSHIRRLICKESYTTQSGGEYQTTYKVQAELINGKTFALAEGLKGRNTADQVLESLRSMTGYTSA